MTYRHPEPAKRGEGSPAAQSEILRFASNDTTVILSEAKDLKLRILRSFAVSAAQDDGGVNSLVIDTPCRSLAQDDVTEDLQ